MKTKYWKPILIGVTAILALGLFFFLKIEKQKVQERAVHIQELKDKAKPYEDQIDIIYRNIDAKRKEFSIKNKLPEILLCFQVGSVQELEDVQGLVSIYDFVPTVVVDLTLEEENMREIFEYLEEKDWDIMAAGNPSMEGFPEDTSNFRAMALSYEIPDSRFCFLEKGQYLSKNVDILKEHDYLGFTQMTNYGSWIESGVMKEGMLFLEHVPVKRGENKIKSSLKISIREKKSLAISFDMKHIKRTGDNTINDYEIAEEVLSEIQKDVEKKRIVVHNATELRAQYLKDQQEQKIRQEEYDKYMKDQENQLAELNKKADEIYSKWKY